MLPDMRQGYPIARTGMRIGLLGGSFDPVHAGHVHLTLEALKRFRLDRIWWLVSPGNPLKPHGPAPLAARIGAARHAMRHPRVVVTDLETRLGTRFTAQTIDRLVRLYPGVLFVWLMGADNLASFHRWDRWPDIFARVPIGVVTRPGSVLPGRLSPAAQRFRAARLPSGEAGLLATARPPAWAFVDMPKRAISSTALRLAAAAGA